MLYIYVVLAFNLKMLLEKESMPSHLPIAARKSGQSSTLPAQF